MDYITLVYIFYFSLIITTAFAIVISRLNKNPSLKFIRLLLYVSILSDLIFISIYSTWKIFLPTAPIYRLLEYFILGAYFHSIIGFTNAKKTIIYLFVIIPIIIIIIFGFKVTHLRILNSIAFSGFSVLFFKNMITDMNIDNPLKDHFFWINAAVLIYFSGTLFLFLIFDPLANANEVTASISYIFHNILGIVKNLVFAYAFWLSYKSLKQSHNLNHGHI